MMDKKDIIFISLTVVNFVLTVSALGLAIDCEVNKVSRTGTISQNSLSRWSNNNTIQGSEWILSDNGIMTCKNSEIDMSVDNKILLRADEVKINNINALTQTILDNYVQGSSEDTTDFSIVLFNGTTGKYIQKSELKIIDDTNIEANNNTSIDMSDDNIMNLIGTNIQVNGSNILTNDIFALAMQIEDPSPPFDQTTQGNILGTLLGSLSFAANFFNIGDMLRFTLDGFILTVTDPDVFTLYILFGGQTINVAITVPFSASGQGLHVDGMLSCRSASEWKLTLNAFVMNSSTPILVYQKGTMAVSLNSSNVFNIQGKWDIGNQPNNGSITCQNFNIYRTYIG